MDDNTKCWQILTTATMRAGWATWRGSWWGRLGTRARRRRGISASMLSTKQVGIQHLFQRITLMIIFNPGNLGRVDFINEFEYDLFVRPDTCNPRYRWGTRGTWHSRHVSWWWVQVLVQLHGGECPHRPEDHLQHRQPQQVQEPLQTGPHPPGQVNLEA